LIRVNRLPIERPAPKSAAAFVFTRAEEREFDDNFEKSVAFAQAHL
jgi:hypothetical protein